MNRTGYRFFQTNRQRSVFAGAERRNVTRNSEVEWRGGPRIGPDFDRGHHRGYETTVAREQPREQSGIDRARDTRFVMRTPCVFRV